MEEQKFEYNPDALAQLQQLESQEEDISQYYLDYSADIEKPTAVIADPNDMERIIVSEGNIFTIAGEAKSYKSFVASRLAIDFFEQHPADTCILVDTEQAEWNVANVARRICRGCGWDYKEAMAKGQLKIANLRPYSCDQRKRITEMILKKEAPKLCIVDGVRDLLRDINDSIECSALIDMLMKASADNKCAIGCILHTNKDGETLRGHVGSELQNKSEIVLFCKRREGGNGVEVSCKMSRNLEIETFELEIDHRFVPVRTKTSTEPELKCGTAKESKALNELPARKDVARFEWVNLIRQAGDMCTEKTATNWFNDYVSKGFLVKSSKEGDFYTHFACLTRTPQPITEAAAQ